MTTAEKVQKISQELLPYRKNPIQESYKINKPSSHSSASELANASTNGYKPKTTKEVVDILLSVNNNNTTTQPNNPPSAFPSFICDMQEFSYWRDSNNRLFNVPFYRPLHSHRKFLGAPLLFIRKIIRKFARFLLEPILQDQIAFNSSIVASINAMYNNTIVFQAFMNTAVDKLNNLPQPTEALEKLHSQIMQVKNEMENLHNKELQESQKSLHIQLAQLEQQIQNRIQHDLQKLDNKLQNEFSEFEKEIPPFQEIENTIMLQLNKLNDKINEIDKTNEAMNKADTRVYEQISALESTTQKIEPRISKLETHAEKATESINSIETIKPLIPQVKEEQKAIAYQVTSLQHSLERELSAVRRIQDIDRENITKKLDDERTTIKGITDELYAQLDHSELQMVKALKKQQPKVTPVSDTEQKEPQAFYFRQKNLASIDKGVSSRSEGVSPDSNDYTTIDYFDFENKFRGTRKNVKISQKQYIPYFIGKQKVIDLGCGRGEFLELLKEHQIEGIGVDFYEDFIVYCQMKGLDVVNTDVVNYLHSIGDSSVDGIFCSQVIEHLSINKLVSLCNRAYQVLNYGGCFIMETPNPTCVATYTNAFYSDPSHIKPVHPQTLEYLLKRAGFTETKIIYTEQSKVDYRLPLLEGENIHNLSQFNDGVNLLSSILFGSMDYAIIAEK